MAFRPMEGLEEVAEEILGTRARLIFSTNGRRLKLLNRWELSMQFQAGKSSPGHNCSSLPTILCLAVGKERLPDFPDEKVPACASAFFFLRA